MSGTRKFIVQQKAVSDLFYIHTMMSSTAERRVVQMAEQKSSMIGFFV